MVEGRKTYIVLLIKYIIPLKIISILHIVMLDTDDKNIYFFNSEQLYKILKQNKRYTTIIEILPKNEEKIILDDIEGLLTIYYNLDNIDIKNAFQVTNKTIDDIYWVERRDEEDIRTNKYIPHIMQRNENVL